METIGARMRLEGARVRLRKEKGYLAEVAFMAKVMSLGMVACKPYGDPPACDFVVLCGACVTRVQVKSGWKEWHGGYRVKTSNYYRPYRESELDVVVVYIVPEDAWYVIPVRELGKTRMASFYPNVRKSRGKLEKWREAWQLLAGSGRPAAGSRNPKVPRLGANKDAGFRAPARLARPGPSTRAKAALTQDDTLSRRRARVAWEALGEWMFER